MDVSEQIKQKLAPLNPSYLELIDQSHLHAGHKGNTGGGHYHLKIVSQEFEGKNRVERQRIVTTLLKDLFSGNIHALSMETLTEI